MTENRIQQALSRLFNRQRIVFWYDDKKEFREAFGVYLIGRTWRDPGHLSG